MKLGSAEVDDAAVEWLEDNGFDLVFDAERAEMIVRVSERDWSASEVLKAMAVVSSLAPMAWELEAGRLRLMWH